MRSSVCRFEHFLTEWYTRWSTVLNFPVEVSPHNPQGYRKNWEYAAILETLATRGMLEHGRKGLGFAVGQEPLPSVMASYGVDVIATDLMADRVASGWVETSQHATSREALFRADIVDRERFERHVNFMPADMNDLSTVDGQFDFLWSSCAFEHLGSLEHGLRFVENAMRLLKPEGYAIHTTEYNVSSNHDTISEGGACIYRKQDIEALDRRLRYIGAGLEPVDFDAGTHPYDLNYDIEPYYAPGRVHIKLRLEGFICTSMLLIVRKG